MYDPYMHTHVDFQPTPHLDYCPYPPENSPFVPLSTFPPSPLLSTSPYLLPTTIYPQTSSSYTEPSYYSTWGNINNLLPWAHPHHGTSPHIDVHPLLSGDPSYPGFYFNLSSPTFSPMRRIGHGEAIVLSPAELRQPATNPPISRMRIIHHSIPQWPIDLKLRYDGYQTACEAQTPITVGDVLYMIYTSLLRQITHHDWSQLCGVDHDAVTRAYYRRCRRVPSVEALEIQQGVKRVDYLKGKYMFAGLIRAPDEYDFFHWDLITERSY